MNDLRPPNWYADTLWYTLVRWYTLVQAGTLVHLLTLLVILCFAVAHVSGQKPPISFTDISASSGLDVAEVSTPENRYIIESMAGGVALLDCDGDGFLDVATVNGSSVDRFKNGGDLFITLYRQIDGATSKTPKFQNITAAAGLTRKGWGMGVTAVDMDNDGVLDLFITGFAGNAVYKGLGGCKFEDVTERSGLKGSGYMTGSAWADYDRDGDLDVIVPRYVHLDLDHLPVFGSSKSCSFRGIMVQCGPRGLPAESDLYFINKGDGTFEEAAKRAGVSDDSEYFGLGAIAADYDNDGWPDIYIADDGTPNYLYHNLHNGTFGDVSFESGTGYSGAGIEQGSMGVTFGDYDNDGLLDLFVTNFDTEHNTLYRNLGAKGFLDVSLPSKVGAPSVPYVGWGTAFIDFDNDGLLDLFVANGHVYPQVDFRTDNGMLGYRQHFLLHRNLGDGTFEEIAKAAGLWAAPLRSGRGAAFGDLNNDGLVDVVVTNVGDPPTVLLNTTVNANRSVMLNLIQPNSNKFAVGARATLKTSKRSMIREVQAGSSYLSQNDLRLNFGLGNNEPIESLEIRWSDGSIEKIAGAAPGKIITIKKGAGIIAAEDYRKR